MPTVRDSWRADIEPVGQTVEISGSPARKRGSLLIVDFVSRSPVTLFLVLVNLTAFSWIKLHPVSYSSPHILSHYGVNWGYQTLSGQWWRLLTSIFVHIETSHLFINLAILIPLGRHLERILGSLRFALLYVSAGLAGSILLIAFRPYASGYGASLSIFGVLGGLIGFYVLRWAELSNSMRWKLVILIIVATIFIWDDVSMIQSLNQGHIGGLTTGLILGGLFGLNPSDRPQVYSISVVVSIILIILAIEARRLNPLAPHIYAAANAFDRGNKDLALREITNALQLAPEDLTANKIASEVFLTYSEPLQAEKAIRQVLAVDTNDEYFLYLLGIVELRTGRCDDANVIAERLARTKSKYAPMLSKSSCL